MDSRWAGLAGVETALEANLRTIDIPPRRLTIDWIRDEMMRDNPCLCRVAQLIARSSEPW